MTSYYTLNTNQSVNQTPSRSMYNDTDNPFLLSPPPVGSSAGAPAPVASSYGAPNNNSNNMNNNNGNPNPYNNMNMGASVSSGNPYGSNVNPNTNAMPNNMYGQGYQQPPQQTPQIQQQGYYNYGQPAPTPTAAQGYQQPFPQMNMTNNVNTNNPNQAMVVSAAPNQPSNQWSLPTPNNNASSAAPVPPPTPTYSAVSTQKPFDPMTSSYDPFLFTATPKMASSPPVAAPPAPTPVVQQHQPPAPATVVVSNVNNDDDDDIFGVFSSKPKAPAPSQNNNYRSTFNNRPEEIEYDGRDDNLSVLSKSTGGTDHRNKYNSNSSINGADNHNQNSPLNDPKFAPKPPPVRGMDNARTLARNAPPGASPLPNYELVTHSGYILSRISFRTILIKKWKQTFWVSYGQSKILFFRSSQDYEDWISNPYLTQAQRDFLVKANVDFLEDLYKPNVRGYQVTTTRLKAYQNQLLNQYKLERWMDYGPTIAAAFASPNEKDVFNLRTIMSEMMKLSPQASSAIGSPTQRNASSNPYASYNIRPGNDSGASVTNNSHVSPSITNHNSWGYNGAGGVSSAASTGMLDEVRSTASGRTMRSYGVVSTGPMERGNYYSR